MSSGLFSSWKGCIKMTQYDQGNFNFSVYFCVVQNISFPYFGYIYSWLHIDRILKLQSTVHFTSINNFVILLFCLLKDVTLPSYFCLCSYYFYIIDFFSQYFIEKFFTSNISLLSNMHLDYIKNSNLNDFPFIMII